jgi:hypothetical protein
MKNKVWQIVLVTLLVALALSVIVVVAKEPIPADGIGRRTAYGDDTEPRSVTARVASTYTTVITVTSAADPDDSAGYSCYGAPTKPARSPCTLRRALVEADALMDDDPSTRSILIKFDIPTTDARYDDGSGVWVIQITETVKTNPLPTLGNTDFNKSGQVTIDGWSQPDHDGVRPDQPRIIVRGPQENPTEGHVLVVNGNGNTIRGMIFQKFRLGLQMNGGDNVIADNWFGLTADGDAIYLYKEHALEDGSGQSGIILAENVSNNLIQNNHLLGYRGNAINVGSDDSFVLSNTIGTRVDGTVPEVRWERKCHPNARYYNWFAGSGMQVFGHRNTVEYNRIVGMLPYSDDPESTPIDAISVTGDDHVVRHNILGVDADGQPFGICGDGIHVGGALGGHDIQVMTNTVVGAHGTAGIFVTGGEFGYDLNGITIQHNVIKDSTHDAFAFGDKLPSTLRLFNPAQVITISGATVAGTSGLDSPCAGCTVELFLDEIDTVTETLESLATVTADGNGDWEAELPRTLAITEGVRTASTTAVDGQITHPSGDYSAGMTTKISDLHVQSGAPDPSDPPAPTFDPPLPIPAVAYSAPPTRPTTYNTVIVVTNAGDPDDSRSTTCSDVAADQCTLRRALVEADDLMDADPGVRPIQIRFDIPTTDGGYNGAGAWIIELYDTLQLNALPTLGSTDISKSGQVVIDGWSQPDHDVLRADMPRIVVRGADGSKGGLVVNGERNVIRGLAFQRFKDILKLNHGYNTVEDCWFGLTVDGMGVYIRNLAEPKEGSGAAAIALTVNADNNLFQDNVFLGLTGGAINIQGSNDNYVLRNYVGARANGTIDVASVDPANICDPTAASNNWFGGTGINLRGDRNQAISNTIVGLLVQSSALQTPPDAIVISSEQYQDNLIQHNVIGRDANDVDVWTCGRGMDLKARYAYVLSNTIIGTGMEGIYLPSGLIRNNANMMRGNVISDTALAIEFGDLVPDELRFFEPARVITFSESYVAGDDGDDCPYCWVDVYRDDGDKDVEALVYLGSDAADENGNWRLDLAVPIVEGQGLRTISTIRNYGVIQYFEAGTSSKLSGLYRPPVVSTFSPGIGGTIVFTNPYNLSASIQVPGDALEGTTTFTYTNVPEPTQSQGDLAFAGRAFNLDASADLAAGGGVTVTLEYDPEDLLEAAIADVKDLRLFYWTGSDWDDVANTCTPASSYDYDTMAKTVTVRVCHLSSFGLFSTETGFDIYLPLVLRNSD